MHVCCWERHLCYSSVCRVSAFLFTTHTCIDGTTAGHTFTNCPRSNHGTTKGRREVRRLGMFTFAFWPLMKMLNRKTHVMFSLWMTGVCTTERWTSRWGRRLIWRFLSVEQLPNLWGARAVFEDVVLILRDVTAIQCEPLGDHWQPSCILRRTVVTTGRCKRLVYAQAHSEI